MRYEMGAALSLASRLVLILLLTSGGLSYLPTHHHHVMSRRQCSSWIVLRSTNNDSIALNEIRRRLAEITESLEQARKREEEIRLDNNLLQGRRDGTMVETEDIVTRIKRGYA